MKISRVLIAIGAAIILIAINVSILGKERIKHDGEVIFLELAPLDPRSLIQGDYMALRFRLAREIESNVTSAPASNAARHEGEQGLADITLDDKRVARLANAGVASQFKIRYRIRKGAVWLGTNAFFFEEGTDGRYRAARYGEFRLDAASGEAVLVGLRDAQLNAL